METSLRYSIHMIMAAQLCSVKRKGTQVRDGVAMDNYCWAALAVAREGGGRAVARGLGRGSTIRTRGAVFAVLPVAVCSAVCSPRFILSLLPLNFK